MSKDKRAEIVEAMAREMCRTLAPCASMVAEIMDDATYLRGHEGDAAALTLAGQLRTQAEAALDIVLKTVADEVQRLSDKWHNEWRAGHKANTHLEGKFDGADECATAILALTSKGVKE